MQFLTTIDEETTLKDILDRSNSERESWVENLVFDLYGRQKSKDISKKWCRKLYCRSMKVVHTHAEISNSLLALNILLQHRDCSFDEIVGAFQLLLKNKLEQGRKIDLAMPADLNQLIEVCENIKIINDELDN